jgi:ParB-like chromosome segregation protein Spo0J
MRGRGVVAEKPTPKKKKKARRAKDTTHKVPIKSLKPYFRNPRTHTKEQVETIAASIERFGFINPILVDEKNLILAGHGRLSAAKMLGLKEVPVMVVYGLTEAKKRAYCIADNRIAELAGWNENLLGHELLDLKGMDFDLAMSMSEEKKELEGLASQQKLLGVQRLSVHPFGLQPG